MDLTTESVQLGERLAPGGEVRSGWKGRGMSGSGISRKNAEPINIYWDKLKIRLGACERIHTARVPFSTML